MAGPRATRALQRGIRFLLDHQSADDLWRDFHTPAGEASYWPTGFIASALHAVGAEHEPLGRAAAALVAGQNPDGGWGYNASVPTDADSTAWALTFLDHIGADDASRRRAAACLRAHQRTNNGGVATYARPGPIRRFMGIGRWMPFWGWCRACTEVTAAAGCALAVHEPSRHAPAVEAAMNFVCAQQNPAGYWNSYWWTSPHYATAQAARFATLGHRREVAGRAAEWALSAQRDDGGWAAPGAECAPFATAMALSILANSCPAEAPPIERAVDCLMTLQRDDGSWPCGPIMRIPVPAQTHPEDDRRWQPIRFSGGFDVTDQHRLFTTAACVAALGSVASMAHPPIRSQRHGERH
jgi:sporulenol synthase